MSLISWQIRVNLVCQLSGCDIKGVKERLGRLDEQMAALHLKEEEIGAQMATLSLKERELDAHLVESREFSERLSWLVLRVIQGFLQQTQELSVIKFLLSAVLFGSGRSSGPGGSDRKSTRLNSSHRR